MQPVIPREIDVSDLAQLRRDQSPYRVLDIREPWEVAICSLPDSLRIPMQQVPRRIDSLPRDDMLVIVCHHGMRSATVANFLRQNGFDNACNLAGGIDAWARLIDPSMARY
jgi:rhodanese-related sulfurtransferase